MRATSTPETFISVNTSTLERWSVIFSAVASSLTRSIISMLGIGQHDDFSLLVKTTIPRGLYVRIIASKSQTQPQQSPLRGIMVYLKPSDVSGCEIHSHSLLDGGFPDTSYTTREMPATTLMKRFDAVPSNSYGRCAQCAVMK